MLRFVLSFAIAVSLTVCALAQGWLCYGGNAQHSGLYTGTSQSASLVKWQASIDDDRAYYGGEVLIHYAAPMVTPANSVVYGYRFTTTVSGGSDFDNWRIIAKNGTTGVTTWQFATDYSAAVIFPNDWTSVFPATLYQLTASSTARGLAVAAAGGSILVRMSADAASSPSTRLVFYTTAANYTKNAAAFAPIKINTPLTADTSGNIYFGYEVTGSVPASVADLGTGGIAKVNAKTGVSIFKSVESMGIDPSLSRSAMNAAPALTTNQADIYVALTGGNPYLAELETKNLSTVAHVQLFDPSIPGANISLIDESSASPMIGTDGHVYMGVFGNQWRESHGWMLQFDENLSQKAANGTLYPVGSFGWDDTAVVVPSTMVASYKGKAKYLILTKYNNYDDDGGDPGADGSNRVAVLDPTSNSISTDRQTGIPVMNEILTILGPTKTNDDGSHPDAVNEWCINSAAVDIDRKSAIINSEDGHMYRWSFVTNTVTENLDLQPATGEAYTMTAIGPDGQIYVLNNSILFAIGSNKATGVSTVQGTGTSGGLTNVWYVDGEDYSTKAISTPSGQIATIEADFTLTGSAPTILNIASQVTAVEGVTGSIWAYNYSKKAFESIATQTLSASQSIFDTSITSSVTQFIGPGGKVRIRLEGLLPTDIKTPFKFAVDTITSGIN